jgi:DNA-binding transcriptional ArsR family regulator
MTNLSDVFKALGDPNRLAIFELIRERCGPGCVPTDDPDATISKLAEEFDLALSTVSHHLKELRRAGLIICEKRGQHVFCSVNEERLRELGDYLGSVLSPVAKEAS